MKVGEKTKEYKNPKFVGITKEKDVQEQFENRIWMLFANMGFSTMNADREFYMSYDFHDESLAQQVDVLAVDEETVIIVECRAADEMTDQSFAADIKNSAIGFLACEKKYRRNIQTENQSLSGRLTIISSKRKIL